MKKISRFKCTNNQRLGKMSEKNQKKIAKKFGGLKTFLIFAIES